MAGDGGLLSAEGLWGSSAPITAALLARHLNRPILLVTAHLEHADECRDDMELVTDGVELFCAFETLPGEGAACGEIAGERLRLCRRLLEGDRPTAMVAPVQALMQSVPRPQALTANTLQLRVGQRGGFEGCLRWLADQGFERIDWVEQPGDFAVRGGIVDVFAHDHTLPIRVEFLDDDIESIRLFELSSQRSQQRLETLQLSGLRSVATPPPADCGPFVDYLPDDTVICWHEPVEIQELGQTLWERLDNPRGLFPVQRVFASAERFCQVYCLRFAGPALPPDRRFHFDVHSLQRFEAQPQKAIETLLALCDGHRVTVYCDNPAEQQRFDELILDRQQAIPQALSLALGFLHSGFEWRSARHIIIGHHELFHRYRQHRKLRQSYASRPLETWLDLKVGDYVVHTVHGIARFRGIAPLRKGDSAKYEEYLTLEFSGGAVLHVPASQIDLVQKYIGAGGLQPVCSKLGGTRWTRTKQKVEEAVSLFAEDLLRVQALRAAQPGTPYPQDTAWQREFEEAFIYRETEDQLKVQQEIKLDMARPRPMDRLLCGDVGYGKTELAMRAAFKVVEYGRQVAVLVPTTVLAEQHYQTFRERMADYPFEIGCLSRFRSVREQKRLVQAARKGQVDILIGTHRLVSADVSFANLGLVVVDEEQRFGVEHKERLKRLRESVEVLTLTATPIPRTLHMSLLGIRDISALATPPIDRRSIVTQVRQYDEELIRHGIIRELNRDGQVFFVHNRVYNIASVADDIRRIAPQARVRFAHGQMKADELEAVMIQFMRQEVDVLVSTTIIESGIDIPTANTIFINEADRFGLADLHQLRGRVGRYRHRAYCYLLLPQSRIMTPAAAKRLKAIEEYSELGAGFRIAMRDLEIRGAGNVLGPEQSGHIAAVGYEMYCQLLSRTVQRMAGGEKTAFRPVHLELGVVAHIPRHYISHPSARMEIYRRLTACHGATDLTQLQADLRDAFGRWPREVDWLLVLAELRILAQPWTIRSIIHRPPDVIFEVEDLARANQGFAADPQLPGTLRMPDPRTLYWRLPPEDQEPGRLVALLRRRLSAARPPAGT